MTSARLSGAFEGLFELCFFTLGVAAASAAADELGGAGFGVEFVAEGAGGLPLATMEASVGAGAVGAEAGAEEEEEVEIDDVEEAAAEAGAGVAGAATCFGRGGAVTIEAHLRIGERGGES